MYNVLSAVSGGTSPLGRPISLCIELMSPGTEEQFGRSEERRVGKECRL